MEMKDWIMLVKIQSKKTVWQIPSPVRNDRSSSIHITIFCYSTSVGFNWHTIFDIKQLYYYRYDFSWAQQGLAPGNSMLTKSVVPNVDMNDFNMDITDCKNFWAATFDDGPTPYTSSVLDCKYFCFLAKYISPNMYITRFGWSRNQSHFFCDRRECIIQSWFATESI